MSVLEISQTILNFVISITAVIILVFFSILALDVIKFIKVFKRFLNNANKESVELYKRINGFLEGIFNLSFISRFFKKKKK